MCSRRFVVHPAANARASGKPTKNASDSHVETRNTICHRKNRPPARRHFRHPSPIEHCRLRTESNRMKRNTLLIYRKTNASTRKAKIPTRINPMNCAMCSEMCAGMCARSKGERTFVKLDGRNSSPFFCVPRGQPPPKLGKLHPPTCSSAARIPTSARRDHCPKLKRVKSCSRVCCRAGWTESTAGARYSTGIIHSVAPRLDPGSRLARRESVRSALRLTAIPASKSQR